MVFRGEPTALTITLAFANSGDLQIELIHQTGDAPSAYKEFLDSGREGFHHLAWWAEDVAAVEAAVDAAGWPVIFKGDGTSVAAFFYCEAPERRRHLPRGHGAERDDPGPRRPRPPGRRRPGTASPSPFASCSDRRRHQTGSHCLDSAER